MPQRLSLYPLKSVPLCFRALSLQNTPRHTAYGKRRLPCCFRFSNNRGFIRCHFCMTFLTILVITFSLSLSLLTVALCTLALIYRWKIMSISLLRARQTNPTQPKTSQIRDNINQGSKTTGQTFAAPGKQPAVQEPSFLEHRTSQREL